MPNRYEREIEEILRNLEQTEPKAGLGPTLGKRLRRNTTPRMRTQPGSLTWNLSSSERFLLGAVVIALIAGGYAYLAGPNVITLIFAIIAFACMIAVTLSQFLVQPRRVQSIQYGNVTITPLRRGPFSMVRTQWNLLKLKLRYRRRSDHEKP